MLRVTVGVEAHTHEYIATAHEDQKFGLSLAGGQAAEAVAPGAWPGRGWSCVGLHSHIGSQIFDAAGLRGRGAPGARPARRGGRDEHGVELPELDLGGGFGIAYTTEHDPLPPSELAAALARSSAASAPAWASPSRGFGRAGPRDRRARAPSRCTRSARSRTSSSTAGHAPAYVAVDGGMSDNIRTALYDADYSVTLASRRSDAPPMLARVVGKHCESGDIVVKDAFLPGGLAPGDLLAVAGTGAYCRSMASQLQPRAATAGASRCATAQVAGAAAPRDRGRPARPGPRAERRAGSRTARRLRRSGQRP